MGADKFDQPALVGIGETYDDPVFVASNVENHAVVSDTINCRSENVLDILRSMPVSRRQP